MLQSRKNLSCRLLWKSGSKACPSRVLRQSFASHVAVVFFRCVSSHPALLQKWMEVSRTDAWRSFYGKNHKPTHWNLFYRWESNTVLEGWLGSSLCFLDQSSLFFHVSLRIEELKSDRKTSHWDELVSMFFEGHQCSWTFHRIVDVPLAEQVVSERVILSSTTAVQGSAGSSVTL